MNTLDKHRILEKGDEYLTNSNGWQPVPSADWGIQIMFTKYTQVRRPGEKQSSSDTWAHVQDNKTISPDSDKPEAAKPSAIVTAKAENDKTPAPSRSGAGDSSTARRLSPTDQLIKEVEAAITIVDTARQVINAPPPQVSVRKHKTFHEKMQQYKAEKKAAVRPPPSSLDQLKLPFPKGGEMCVWTGRNGTFENVALQVDRVSEKISMFPVGKRGTGNCLIQFPVAVIPQLVDWLKAQEHYKP